jgi:hypothetical protein
MLKRLFLQQAPTGRAGTAKPGWPAEHFYSPFPDLEDIRRRESILFPAAQAELPGVSLNLGRQLEVLQELGRFYPEMPFTDQRQDGFRYYFDNPNFRHGEAIVLYAMIRWLRPRRIVEIGSGFSSSVMLDTNQRFFNYAIDCTFIEPHPELLNDLLFPEDRDRVQVLAEKVYNVGLDTFGQLTAGDILFVDSSHVAKIGSDVTDIFFRILPALQPGVYIHFHDIGHDFEYPKEWIYQGRAWNESYVLRAFLQYNQVFRIEFFNSYIREFQTSEVMTLLPLVGRTAGSSIWLRKAA